MILGREAETPELKKTTDEINETDGYGKNAQISAWDSEKSGKSVDDINTDLLRSHINMLNESGRVDCDLEDETGILNQLELLNDGEITNAAIAVFGKKPSIELKMDIFATDVKHTSIDSNRQKGGIIELIDIGEKYIKRNIRWRVVTNGASERVEIPELPIAAVREAMLNSYLHRDYGAPQSNEITIYSNRIEIYNPGAFPAGLTPQDFITGSPKPVRRNPLIARIMRDSGTECGGLRKIAEECDAADIRYKFVIDKFGFSIIFYRARIPVNETFVDTADAGRTGEENFFDSPRRKISKAEKAAIKEEYTSLLLEYCSSPRTRYEMQQYLGNLNREYFRRNILGPLLESRQLSRTVSDKPTSRNQKYIRT